MIITHVNTNGYLDTYLYVLSQYQAIDFSFLSQPFKETKFAQIYTCLYNVYQHIKVCLINLSYLGK